MAYLSSLCPKAFLITLVIGTLCLTPRLPALSSRPNESTQPNKEIVHEQDGQANPPESIKVKSRLVVVDVVVRDKKGQPITDLTEQDFKVTEDGKKQKISVFSFQSPGAVKEAIPSLAQPASLPPNVFRNRPKFKANQALNVVLIDALNCSLLNQAYVRVEMVKFLEKLPEGQPIAIFAMGKKLRMLQDFTTDLTDLKRVIQNFKTESSPLMASPTGAPEMAILGNAAEQSLIELDPALLDQINAFTQDIGADQTDMRIQYTMAALSSLAQMLAGYPGRKNLIWISESIPLNIFPEINTDHTSVSVRAGNPINPAREDAGINSDSSGAHWSAAQTHKNSADQLAELSNQLADAQVAVYPVDARGLVAPTFYDVSNNISGQSAMGGLAGRMAGKQADELFVAHTNMLDFADKTGGMAFYNRNDLDVAVRKGIEDGSTYYTIGYYPENKTWNGRFRKIHVSVDQAGVKIRHREGYFAIDRAAYAKEHSGLSDGNFSLALNVDYPVSTALQFEVRVVPPAVPGTSKVRINYVLEPRQVAFETTTDGMQRAQVDCAARAYIPNNADHPIKTEVARMDAKLNAEQYRNINKSYYPCQVNLDLPPGQYVLRLAVRDNISGALGSMNAGVVVPAKATAENGASTVPNK